MVSSIQNFYRLIKTNIIQVCHESFNINKCLKFLKSENIERKTGLKNVQCQVYKFVFFYYIVPPVNFSLATKCFLSNTYYIDSFYLFLMHFSFSIFQVKDIFYVFKVFRYQRETL